MNPTTPNEQPPQTPQPQAPFNPTPPSFPPAAAHNSAPGPQPAPFYTSPPPSAPAAAPPTPTMTPPATNQPFMGHDHTSPQTDFQHPAPKMNKNNLIIGGAAIVAVALLVGGYFIFFNKSGSNPISTISNAITGTTPDVVDRPDGTLDLSNLIDTNKTIKKQDIKAKINQQVNLSDGTSYMVTKVERNYPTTSVLLRPADGKELVKVNVVVGNRAKSDSSFITGGFLKLKNSAGGLVHYNFVVKDEVPDVLSSQEIAPGKQVKGSIIFTVDQDEKIQGFVTSDDFENYTTKEKITIASEVSL